MLLDLSQLNKQAREAVAYALSKDFDKKLIRAIREQRAAAARLKDAPPTRRDGIGAQKMAIHPLFNWVAHQKYGKDARSPEFWDWVAKKEDVFRVQTNPERVTVSMPALPKFRKVYPCKT